MSKTTLTVLSAGAVKPGLTQITDSFRRQTGYGVEITFATAPAISKRIAAGTIPDVVIAPPGVLDEWRKRRIATLHDPISVGRIGVGVFVREGAELPKIVTVEEFNQALLRCESLVYNRASTGIYLEELFERLGIATQLKSKTTRYPEAAAVLGHIRKGKGTEIGLAALTVIIEGQQNGLKLVGPLPPEIQHYTSYVAIIWSGSSVSHEAQAFINYLASPAGRDTLSGTGIE
jgi:molybdate transport system substrate-binding protein